MYQSVIAKPLNNPKLILSFDVDLILKKKKVSGKTFLLPFPLETDFQESKIYSIPIVLEVPSERRKKVVIAGRDHL